MINLVEDKKIFNPEQEEKIRDWTREETR